ncbi:carboxypeptidase-like regulatory domain-containing protein [Hymenobacter sp. 5414T-23]|uniref:carboxypeptidase-like regulatory domain-containing protein n=1 Tax=Hymenobacter sp. 5414T-23 TaxID=2932252 RepID=UPI001FD521B4|nr:carboxypeptidase-like regulatory domain-containing protein [Hymenobacter sp. 5414T-23]UOQ80471.1 carboxypeptidase-like regulatory domain-containing protein [Hymenobacter sp. 5414T-23]
MKIVYLLLLLLLLVGVRPTWAQRVVFSGRITEAATGKAVPFASVFVPGSGQGTTADENGRYQLPVAAPVDSLAASAIGFGTVRKRVSGLATHTVNFALGAGAVSLGEVVVRPGRTPLMLFCAGCRSTSRRTISATSRPLSSTATAARRWP